MSEADQITQLREQLEDLKQKWRDTPASDKASRRALKKEFGGVYQALRDCGVGNHPPKQNHVPEHRDKFSIWHIRNQRVEIPPTLTARQAVECLTNGSCGD